MCRYITILILSLIVLTSQSTSQASYQLSGDFTGDCTVDMNDLQVLTYQWLTTESIEEVGLVAYWKFDETSGETLLESISSTQNSLYGEPEWRPESGMIGGALYFDGIDDYAELPNNLNINGTSARTCTAWMKCEQDVHSFFLTWGNASQPGSLWTIGAFGEIASQPGISRQFSLTINGTPVYSKNQPGINDELWHHIAVVLPEVPNPTSADIRLFIDGFETETEYNQVIDINTSPVETIQIGQCPDRGAGWASKFKGMLDEIRIYDRALESHEIYNIYKYGNSSSNIINRNINPIIDNSDFSFLAETWNLKISPVIISEFLADNDSDTPPDSNSGQILDGLGDSSDWIELHNLTSQTINIDNWTLTDKENKKNKWAFPQNTTIAPHGYLLVFASKKEQDDYPENYPFVDSSGYLHTNFSLNNDGEYLGLFNPAGEVIYEYKQTYHDDDNFWGFPEQEENISFGIFNETDSYFAVPTPEADNKPGYLSELDKPKFSHKRGFYNESFSLELTTDTENAVIRYTTDGSNPTSTNGNTYTEPIPIISNSLTGIFVRAVVEKIGHKTSPVASNTYIFNNTTSARGLPALSLVGEAGEVFYNPNGVMAISGGTWSSGVWRPINSYDYNNLMMRGMDYERPVSCEWINNKYDESFHEDCGLRIHGSAWMRPRYTTPTAGIWYGSSKISQRLYFRNKYGSSNLKEPILEKFPEADKFDALVIRAGHNDISNPFVRDEMLRRLQYYIGHPASKGTFANLFINGVYKGYFNPCERINEDFCQMAFDSDLPWDIVGWVQPDNVLEARDGDTVAFKEYISFVTNNDLSNPVNYQTAIDQIDLVSFIDYLIIQSWSGNWDWPQNNWAAASERSDNPKWHFFVWDGEGGMDNTAGQNRFNELNGGGHDLAKLYRGLKANTDFQQLFCDRIQKHFFETNGWMQKNALIQLFGELADEISGVISNINQYVPTSFIPSRENIFITQCINEGLYTFAGPRFFFDGIETSLTGKQTPMSLSMENADGNSGTIFYTLDGTDPRLSTTSREVTYTLVPENAAKNVLVPTSNIGTAWQGLPQNEPYNISDWTDGLPVTDGKAGGVGYETEPGSSTSNVPYVSYDILDEMQGINTSVYIRIPFEIASSDFNQWNFLTLKMRYDDGFAAYINGQKVSQAGYNGTPSWNSSSRSHENSSQVSFSISEHLDKLQLGTNVLAIHGMNTSLTSTDFIISAELEGGLSTNSIISPTAIEYTTPVTLDKSETIKARTLDNETWSSLREAKCIIGSVNDLRISEIMYNPLSDPNEEYLEFTNIGDTTFNLKNCSITDGVEFTFPDTDLQPGEYALVVADKQIFNNKYGTDKPVIGQYSGRLDNSGEKVSVQHNLGVNIHSVEFDDNWHSITDGKGFSLTATDLTLNTESDISNNLIAHYHLNEFGDTVHDKLGNYNGQLVGSTPKSRTDSILKLGLRMDGYNNHIVMPNGIMSSLDDFSFSCWFKLPFKYKSARILECSNSDSAVTITANLDGYYNITINSSGQTVSLTSQSKTNIGKWTHFAVTKTGATCTIYEDGLIIGQSDSFTLSPADLDTLTNNWIGRSSDTSISYFDGWMDEVRFYNAALSDSDIMTLSQENPWNSKSAWRPSSINGGTPGRAETAQEQVPATGSIVIHEILSHSHATLPDWIELKNTTSQDIDISGWFLSDSNDSDAERKKYQIPANTVLTPADPYYVVEESSFNNALDPQCRTAFALSEGGETLYLQSANGEVLTGYYQSESFGAAESNISFGRHQKSNGSWNFVPLSAQTKGAENAYPKVGPIIITEIMYNPANDDQDLEYIELTNISTQPVITSAYATTYLDVNNTQSISELVPWKFTEGIEYEFPVNLVFQPNQTILLVKDSAAFNAHYTSVPQNTLIYQWDTGGLANDGEKLEIAIPGDKDYAKDRYYIRTDRVNYEDRLPWTFQADGTGKSLTHLRPDDTGNNYTNDPANWIAADPTPGIK